jgi:hypothetical protein
MTKKVPAGAPSWDKAALRTAAFANGIRRRMRFTHELIPGLECDMVSLKASERLALAKAGERDLIEQQCALVIACARVPETDEALFAPGDIDALKELPALALDSMAETAMVMNGLGVQGAEDAAKN